MSYFGINRAGGTFKNLFYRNPSYQHSMTLDSCIYQANGSDFCQSLVLTFQLKAWSSALIRPQHSSAPPLNALSWETGCVFSFSWLQKLFQLNLALLTNFSKWKIRFLLSRIHCLPPPKWTQQLMIVFYTNSRKFEVHLLIICWKTFF